MIGTLAAGDRIGSYRIEGQLGFGGMGSVYSATHELLGRRVAIKVLFAHLSTDETFRERFRREARLSASLNHPNIATVYEAGEQDGTLYLVMSLIDGQGLQAMIGTPELDPRRVLELLTPIADALDTAHSAGIIHRDVKPENILVSSTGTPYLVDFGITKELGQRTLTQTNRVVGSLGYVSPEQIEGRPVDARTDVYALSIVLFECLAGRVPFERDNDTAVMFAHLHDDPPAVSSLATTLPPEIDRVITKGMAKSPDDRFASASALLSASTIALASAITAPAPTPAGPPVTAAPRAETPSVTESLAATSEASSPGTETVFDRKRPAPPAPEPVTPDSPPRRWPWIAIPAAALVVGVSIGLVTRSGDAASAPAPVRASDGRLSVAYDTDDWLRPGAAVAIDGLDVTDPISLVYTPAGGTGALLAGGVGDGSAADLPAALETSFPKEVSPPQPVLLNGNQAVRYVRAQGSGGQQLRAYVLPTTRGRKMVACQAPASSATFAAACDSVAATLKISDADTLPVQPSPAYAAGVGGAIRKLNEAREQWSGDLDSASRALRAKAADRLSDAQTQASKAVHAIAPPPAVRQTNQRLADALQRGGRAFVAMAKAARDDNASGFRSAAAELTKADKALTAQLAALDDAGYPVE